MPRTTAANGTAANAAKNKNRTTRRRMSVAGTTRRSNVAKAKTSGATMNARLRTNSAGKGKISGKQTGSARISNALNSSDNRNSSVREMSSDASSISAAKPRTSNAVRAKSKDGTPSLDSAIASRSRGVFAQSRKGGNRKMDADSIRNARPKNSDDAQIWTDSAIHNAGAMTRDETTTNDGNWSSSGGRTTTSDV